MTGILRAFAAVVVAGLLPPTPTPHDLSVGKAAPPILATGLDGKAYPATAPRGKPALVNAFVSGCAPCRNQIAVLVTLYPRYKGRVTFVGIDEGEPADAVSAFAKHMHIPYDLAVDRGDMSATFAASPLPRTALIDAHGTVTAVWTTPLSQRQLEHQLARVAGS